MFKKPFSVNLSNKLSGADRKKLRRGLEKNFPLLSPDDLEVVLPAKAGDMETNKISAPSRTVIYTLDKVPLVIDLSGKGDLVPTIFALWRVPHMLPRIHVKHPFVTQYLVNGADLMLPGADVSGPGGPLPEFEKGDMVCVCVLGNPAPLAVGVAGMSSADATQKAAQGLKGKLVEVLQSYGDCLWADIGGRGVANAGYVQGGVVPLGTDAGALRDAHEDENGEGEVEAAEASASEAGLREETGGAAAAGQESLVEDVEEMSMGTSTTEGEESGAAEQAVPMEELLETSLLQALHRSIKDDMLPLNSSQLWNQHILPSRPFGSNLDVKKSKHKKMSKFLSAYGGKDGMLNLKEDRHSGDVQLTGVNRQHEMYMEYRPYRLDRTAGAAEASSSAATAGASNQNPGSTELLIEELYKPGKELRPVFEALNLPYDILYTMKEVGEVGFAYVVHAKLGQGVPDPRSIFLDVVLCDALFKGLVKKGELFPSHMAKADLREAMLRRCQAQVRISRGTQQVIKKGAVPKLTVSTAKRQGHKITLVVGAEPFLLDPAVIASECQKKFACATTVNELPGKSQGSEVVIQGAVVEKCGEFIMKKFGVPKSYMDIKK